MCSSAIDPVIHAFASHNKIEVNRLVDDYSHSYLDSALVAAQYVICSDHDKDHRVFNLRFIHNDLHLLHDRRKLEDGRC